jgi:hypothetical protein
MALTGSFKELVQNRVASNPAFGDALLREGIDTGKAILRDHIKAIIGLKKLGKANGAQSKSLISLFGPRDNPQAGRRRAPCNGEAGVGRNRGNR